MNAYDLALGARFARGAGWFRLAVTVVTCAVATSVLSAALAFPEALAPYAEHRLSWLLAMGVTLLLVGVPLAASVMTVSRLAARERTARLAALRVLGVAPGRVRRLAAAENLMLALPGTLFGLLLVPAAMELIRLALAAYRLRPVQGLVARPVDGLMVAGGVLAVFALATQTPVHAADRSEAEEQRLTWARLGLLVAGAALWAAARADRLGPGNNPGDPGDDHHTYYSHVGYHKLSFGAVGCAALGLLVASPYLVKKCGDVLARARGPVAMTLAGRRLQANPGATGRLVGALTVCLFVTTSMAGFVTTLLTDPAYREVQAERARGFTLMLYGAGAATTGLDETRRAPGVVDAGILPTAEMRSRRSTETSTSTGDAFVGTCAQLRTVMDVGRCDDGAPMWLAVAGQHQEPAPGTDVGLEDLTVRGTPPSVVVGDQYDPTTPEVAVSGIRPPVPAASRFPAYGTLPRLFVPRALAGRASIRTVQLARLAPGTAARPTLDALGTRGLAGADPEEEVHATSAIRDATWGFGALLCAVLGLTAAAAAVDRARESRRATVMLRATGTSWRTLAAAEAWQVAVPLLVGGVLTVVLGVFSTMPFTADLAVGRAFDTSPPWGAGLVMLGVLLVAVAGVAACAAALIPRRVSAADLRRE